MGLYTSIVLATTFCDPLRHEVEVLSELDVAVVVDTGGAYPTWTLEPGGELPLTVEGTGCLDIEISDPRTETVIERFEDVCGGEVLVLREDGTV